ncbi:hypothetical protein DFH09DRAFT_1344564 [Mycena vulgaris]|nr:hypothetical protein DFH09DRAFT_1344564 [Mycena vulgaris]
MAHGKSSKTKTMFKPYVEADVPEVMLFPDWILNVGIRGHDLPSLTKKTAAAVYEQVKNAAFNAKAFQHEVQPQDWAEEAHLPALVVAWKQNNPKQAPAADDADASDQEEDEGGRASLLCGYRMVGWCIAIQKVISNKCSADKHKTQDTKTTSTAAAPDAPSLADNTTGNASILTKLFGLAAYAGHDKFRDDRHDDIYELSKTFTHSCTYIPMCQTMAGGYIAMWVPAGSPASLFHISM